MRPDSTARSEADGEVMAAEDDGRLVIADISRDGAWLAMALPDTCTVAEYR